MGDSNELKDHELDKALKQDADNAKELANEAFKSKFEMTPPLRSLIIELFA